METMIITSLIVTICLICFAIGYAIKTARQKDLEDKKAEEKERAKRIAYLKEREQKEKQDWENLLEERTKQYGMLTKHIHIQIDKQKDIYVYEDTKTIFILGDKYSFSEIRSCTIDKEVIRGRTTTMITEPDRFEMNMQELLYGLGKKYNVKSQTKVINTPDIVKYNIYIGTSKISTPQITFTLKVSEKANEIKNLIDIIAATNK